MSDDELKMAPTDMDSLWVTSITSRWKNPKFKKQAEEIVKQRLENYRREMLGKTDAP